MEKDDRPTDCESLASDVWVPAPLDAVWDFFKEPANLNRLTPSHYGLSLQARGPTQDGSEVDIRFAPLGLPLPLQWTSQLSEVVASGSKRKFVDSQIRGPMSYWRHEHLFEEGVAEITGDLSGQKMVFEPRGTWIRDRIWWAPPLGKLGQFGIKAMIEKNLTSLLEYRRDKALEFFKK